MKRSSKLAIVFVWLVGCGGGPIIEQLQWRVTLQSSGGLAGAGTGNVVASSDVFVSSDVVVPSDVVVSSDIEVGLQAVAAALAAVARLLVAAERAGRVETVERVGPDHAGAQLAGQGRPQL